MALSPVVNGAGKSKSHCMNQTIESTQQELARRHQSAKRFVSGLATLTLVLVAVALVISRSRPLRNNPSLDIAWRISVPIFGLCAVALRRTKFSVMRLQDIAALGGASALLSTLQQTTVQVALLGCLIALIGFAVTILTNADYYVVGSAIIALAVLLYCYPRRNAWQRLVQAIERTGDANNAPDPKGTVI